MKRPAFVLPCCLLLCLTSPVQAVICKTIDEHGVVSYTDTPSTECENPVKLQDYSRYAPRSVDRAGGASAAGEDDAFPGYASIRIVQPPADGTIRSNEGKVPVQVALQPGLQKGHRIQLVLNGTPVGSPLASTDVVLSGIERGTHQLGARVMDGKGETLGSAVPVSFTLRKEALDSPSDDDTPGDGDDVYTPDFAPDDTADFTPDNDYSPRPGGIPQSPGTNPAFAPRYQP